MKYKDMRGVEIGGVKGVRYIGSCKDGKAIWEWKCLHCGKIFKATSDGIKQRTKINKSHNTSCGCLQIKAIKKTGSKNKIHGFSRKRIYTTHGNMMRRCYNKLHKSYKHYGGRGIKVCKAWHKLENFVKWAESSGDYKDTLTIERIDNYKGYNPQNCTWIPMSKQACNQTTNRLITYNGMTLYATEWSRRTGINRTTLTGRLDYNWSVKKALTTPVRKK